jgi:2-polyprenyl-6-methoxyphenol hydroxylase-like FAD-dependent oxidoreductase
MNAKHQVLIVGGGTAGITVAARLLRKGYTDVAVIEPEDKHYYQPLWTLVGGFTVMNCDLVHDFESAQHSLTARRHGLNGKWSMTQTDHRVLPSPSTEMTVDPCGCHSPFQSAATAS